LEIEHILPNKPEDDLHGKWATENPGVVYDDYKNRLGNLTLLEKPINIVAGNDFYAVKQGEYRKSGNYLTRSLVELANVGLNTSISRINEKLEAFSDWNAASIEKRHSLLIALVKDVWKTTPIDA
ncbi:MAG: HNH endonuclease family protein, partial [Gemmatimonadota bacterium]|nr:HNH endonuclease family protein [Gemmatimonadota bacterium]